MKQLFRLLYLPLSLCLLLGACKKYLDEVPANIATIDDAFKTPSSATNFFYSLYSYIPVINDPIANIDLWSTDEIAIPWDRSQYKAKYLMRGNLNSSSPLFNCWSSGGMYDGIRQCYIFLNNIDKTPDISDADKKRMKGEATFLVAYYHFVLMRMYGPVVLVTNEIPVNSTGSDYFPKRQPYDTCVSFVSNLLDKAATLLPATITASTELGRATSVVSKSIKARLLLYAASPLFNGNAEFYNSFKNSDGTPLMATTYDASKWKKAADACLDAINAAQAAGIQLYTSTIAATDPAQRAQNNYRYSMVDPWNKELVWGYSNPEPYYGWQRHSMPRVSGLAYNGNSPTLKIVETYYTKNGLPIEADPDFDYANRFKQSGSTILLHQNREPRFYASIAYDRGTYLANATAQTMLFHANEANGWSTGLNDYSPTGYLVQKGVHPNSQITLSVNQLVNYPWPIVRLAELYLGYAEALNEYEGTAAQSTVLQYIDPIRIRAGIPGVAAAWAKIGKTAFTQEEMRDIIRRERMIELAFEGHRCWDIRRWKLGAAYFNVPVYGLNIQGVTATDFNQPVIVENRVFNTPGYYLFPISTNDLSINKNLVQNPGW